MKPYFTLILATGLTLAVASTGQATLLSYQGAFEISTSPFPEIVSGDTFDFMFTYDDAITDSNITTVAGSFAGALTAISLTAGAGNTGTWDPSGGTFTLPGAISTTAAGVNVFGQGTGFPPLGGTGVLGSLLLEFNGIPITDTGIGQSLAAQLGGPLPGDLSAFTSTEGSISAFFGPRTVGSLTSFSAVPEPSTMLLFGTGMLGLLLWHSRRRKHSAV